MARIPTTGPRGKQFGIRSLLLGIALIAVGLAAILIPFSIPGSWNDPMTIAILPVGGACVGAGILAPIGRLMLGAAIGFITPIALLSWLFYMLSSHAW
jgi:hypothetical protein